MAKQRPTRRQLEVLRAYIQAGSVTAAAYELGISETPVQPHLSGLYRRTGVPERGAGGVPPRIRQTAAESSRAEHIGSADDTRSAPGDGARRGLG